MKKMKTLKASSKQKNYPIKKKNQKFMFLVGSVGSHTILHDPIRSYLRSYHFYDPSAILNVLVRWDSKIMRSYDPNRDFDNHDGGFQLAQLVKSLIVE